MKRSTWNLSNRLEVWQMKGLSTKNPVNRNMYIKIFVVIAILTLMLISLAKADVVDDLVPIIIQAESSGNPQASDGQSYGLMGISPSVIKDYNSYNYYLDNRGARIYTRYPINIGDLYDPSTNVKVGTWYLNWIREQLPEQFKDSKVHLIAAYNWGLGNLRKNKWIVPKWFYIHPNKIYRKVAKGEK